MSKLRFLLLLSIFSCCFLMLKHIPILYQNPKSLRFVSSVHVQVHDSKLNADRSEDGRTHGRNPVRTSIGSITEKKPPLFTPAITTSLSNEKEEIMESSMQQRTSFPVNIPLNVSKIDRKVTQYHKIDDRIESTVPKFEKSKDASNKNANEKTDELCSSRGENLVGRLHVDQSIPKDLNVIEKLFSVEYGGAVEMGGWWKPSNCNPRAKVAVIIPYRKRFEQLKIFLRHMHPFLQRQQLHYRIIVVEMLEDDPFNRAGLFNIGFVEALKLDDFNCFVFSDVDLLPEDDRNYYGCPTSPRHMSVGVDKFNYRLPYATIFGGVGSFRREHFEKINGMSNMFWGWGGEDDDLYARITAAKLSLTRPSVQIGRYTMVRIHHFQSSKADANRMNLLRNSKERMMFDGLNTLKYDLREVEQSPLVTFVKIIMKRSQYIAS